MGKVKTNLALKLDKYDYHWGSPTARLHKAQCYNPDERVRLKGAVENDFVYSFLQEARDIEENRDDIAVWELIHKAQSKIENRTMPHHEYSHLAGFARCYEESSNKYEIMEIFLTNLPDHLWGYKLEDYNWEKGSACYQTVYDDKMPSISGKGSRWLPSGISNEDSAKE